MGMMGMMVEMMIMMMMIDDDDDDDVGDSGIIINSVQSV
jgi:hypothetical protein